MSLDEWNAACDRLEDFLDAHRVQDRALVLRLTTDLLAEARRLHAENPIYSPVETTLDLATAQTEAWFSRLAADTAPTDGNAAARARVAYFAAGAHREWPAAFLDPDPPAAMIEAIRRASIQAGPDLEFTSLIRREVDYGPVEDLARETWEQFSWSHVLRAFLIWVVIFFAAYGSYLAFFA